MPGTRHEFAPAVTSQQAIDGAVIDLMSDFGFISRLDLGHGGDFSSGGLREEGGEERLLFLQRQILMPTASLAWRFQGCRPQAIVGRNDAMHRGG